MYRLIFIVLLTGCMNIPEQKIATTSSHKLCQTAGYTAVSAENRELIYKEIERRGQSCTSPNSPPLPPQQTTRTNCNKVGDSTYCTTR